MNGTPPPQRAAVAPERSTLAEYVATLGRHEDGSPIKEAVKWFLTSVLVPVERRQARKIAGAKRPLRLHQGCANHYLEGWVNLDLYRPGRRLDLRWDLRRGVPFPDESVDAVFSEHLLEHLPLEAGLHLLAECYRVLRPSGILRIGVPDLGRYVRSYVDGDTFISMVRPGRPTPALALIEPFFRHGHRSMYDFETLRLALSEAGFNEIERSKAGESRIDPAPDSAARAAETLYVEATK